MLIKNKEIKKGTDGLTDVPKTLYHSQLVVIKVIYNFSLHLNTLSDFLDDILNSHLLLIIPF